MLRTASSSQEASNGSTNLTYSTDSLGWSCNSAAQSPSARIYVFFNYWPTNRALISVGGMSSHGSLKEVSRYTLVKNEWNSLPELPIGMKSAVPLF